MVKESGSCENFYTNMSRETSLKDQKQALVFLLAIGYGGRFETGQRIYFVNPDCVKRAFLTQRQFVKSGRSIFQESEIGRSHYGQS